ncbi:MAG: hypothetical protein VKJ46_13600 [Leptolyngbyaceae bacterium]|nr:hypothetical protein [Leptolyngbyaceae bacterium]
MPIGEIAPSLERVECDRFLGVPDRGDRRAELKGMGDREAASKEHRNLYIY